MSSIQIASMLSGAIAPEVWGRANIDAFRAAVLVQGEIAKGRNIVNITKEGDDVIFNFDNGQTERISIRALLDAVHQKDIDGQMEKLSKEAPEAFEDIDNIGKVLDEIKVFLKSIGSSHSILDQVEALKGKNADGRAFVRLVRGVTFRGHAGGQGVRVNANLKGNDKELKAVIIHEIIAGLFGDHFLAERVEQAFRADHADTSLLAQAHPLSMPIWNMTPEERLGVDRDFIQNPREVAFGNMSEKDTQTGQVKTAATPALSADKQVSIIKTGGISGLNLLRRRIGDNARNLTIAAKIINITIYSGAMLAALVQILTPEVGVYYTLGGIVTGSVLYSLLLIPIGFYIWDIVVTLKGESTFLENFSVVSRWRRNAYAITGSAQRQPKRTRKQEISFMISERMEALAEKEVQQKSKNLKYWQRQYEVDKNSITRDAENLRFYFLYSQTWTRNPLYWLAIRSMICERVAQAHFHEYVRLEKPPAADSASVDSSSGAGGGGSSGLGFGGAGAGQAARDSSLMADKGWSRRTIQNLLDIAVETLSMKTPKILASCGAEVNVEHKISALEDILHLTANQKDELRQLVRKYFALERLVHRIKYDYVTAGRISLLSKTKWSVFSHKDLQEILRPLVYADVSQAYDIDFLSVFGEGAGLETAIDRFFRSDELVSMTLEAFNSLDSKAGTGFEHAGIAIVYSPEIEQDAQMMAINAPDEDLLSQHGLFLDEATEELAQQLKAEVLTLDGIRRLREEMILRQGARESMLISIGSYLQGPFDPREAMVSEGIKGKHIETIVVADALFDLVHSSSLAMRNKLVKASEYFKRAEGGELANVRLREIETLREQILRTLAENGREDMGLGNINAAVPVGVGEKRYTASEIKQMRQDGTLDLRSMTGDPATITDDTILVLTPGSEYIIRNGARMAVHRKDNYYWVEGGGMPEELIRARQERERQAQGQTVAQPQSGPGAATAAIDDAHLSMNGRLEALRALNPEIILSKQPKPSATDKVRALSADFDNLGERRYGLDPQRKFRVLGRESGDMYGGDQYYFEQEILGVIQKFRRQLKETGIDIHNPEAITSYAQEQGFTVSNSQDAENKLLVKFIADNPDVIHEISDRTNQRLKWRRAVETRRDNLSEEISNLAITAESVNLQQWVPAIKAAVGKLNDAGPGIVSAQGRIFTDQTGKVYKMWPGIRLLTQKIRNLIIKNNIPVLSISHDTEMMFLIARKMTAHLREGILGLQNPGSAAGQTKGNTIYMPEDLDLGFLVNHYDLTIAHEVGHVLDNRYNCSARLLSESEETIIAFMAAAEPRFEEESVSLRDEVGRWKVKEFIEAKADDWTVNEIVAEAFAQAVLNPEAHPLVAQFFRPLVPGAFENTSSTPVDQAGQRSALIRDKLANLLGHEGIAVETDSPEVTALAERILQAQLAGNGQGAQNVDINGINIPGLEKINPAEFRFLGMMDGLPVDKLQGQDAAQPQGVPAAASTGALEEFARVRRFIAAKRFPSIAFDLKRNLKDPSKGKDFLWPDSLRQEFETVVLKEIDLLLLEMKSGALDQQKLLKIIQAALALTTYYSVYEEREPENQEPQYRIKKIDEAAEIEQSIMRELIDGIDTQSAVNRITAFRNRSDISSSLRYHSIAVLARHLRSYGYMQEVISKTGLNKTLKAYSRDEINANPDLANLVKTITGFGIPESIGIVVFPDGLHIVLDDRSYVLSIRNATQRRKAEDLSVEEQRHVSLDGLHAYLSSGGTFVQNIPNLPQGLVTFERAPYDSNIASVMNNLSPLVRCHERQHKFFHMYFDQRIKNTGLPGELYLFQDEFISILQDGSVTQWTKTPTIKEEDELIDSWIRFYIQYYLKVPVDSDSANMALPDYLLKYGLSNIEDLRVFLKKSWDMLQDIVAYKNRLLHRSEPGISAEEADRKACEYVAALLLTVPFTDHQTLKDVVGELHRKSREMRESKKTFDRSISQIQIISDVIPILSPSVGVTAAHPTVVEEWADESEGAKTGGTHEAIDLDKADRAVSVSEMLVTSRFVDYGLALREKRQADIDLYGKIFVLENAPTEADLEKMGSLYYEIALFKLNDGRWIMGVGNDRSPPVMMYKDVRIMAMVEVAIHNHPGGVLAPSHHDIGAAAGMRQARQIIIAGRSALIYAALTPVAQKELEKALAKRMGLPEAVSSPMPNAATTELGFQIKIANIDMIAETQNTGRQISADEQGKRILQLYRGIGMDFQILPLAELIQHLDTGEAGAHRLSVAEKVEASQGAKARIRMATFPGRLDHSISLIEATLKGDKHHVVYDIGIGWSREGGPITVKELAGSLAGKAKIYGIDAQIPFYLIRTASRENLLFDKDDNLLSVQTVDSFETPETISEAQRKQYAELARRLRQTAEMRKTQDYTSDGNQILFNPVGAYETANLEFREGDLFALSGTSLPKADIVRIANLLIPDFSPDHIGQALQSLVGQVNEGDRVIISYSPSMIQGEEDALVYIKKDGRFIFEGYAFSVNGDGRLDFGVHMGGWEVKASPAARISDEFYRILKSWDKFTSFPESPDWKRYPKDADRARREFKAKVRDYSKAAADFLAKGLRSEGVDAEGMGSMVLIRVNSNSGNSAGVEKKLFDNLDKDFFSKGVPFEVLAISAEGAKEVFAGKTALKQLVRSNDIRWSKEAKTRLSETAVDTGTLTEVTIKGNEGRIVYNNAINPLKRTPEGYYLIITGGIPDKKPQSVLGAPPPVDMKIITNALALERMNRGNRGISSLPTAAPASMAEIFADRPMNVVVDWGYGTPKNLDGIARYAREQLGATNVFGVELKERAQYFLNDKEPLPSAYIRAPVIEVNSLADIPQEVDWFNVAYEHNGLVGLRPSDVKAALLTIITTPEEDLYKKLRDAGIDDKTIDAIKSEIEFIQIAPLYGVDNFSGVMGRFEDESKIVEDRRVFSALAEFGRGDLAKLYTERKERWHGQLAERVNHLAENGILTLANSDRVILREEYNEWIRKYNSTHTDFQLKATIYSQNDIPKDYPISEWGRNFRLLAYGTNYLMVIEKVRNEAGSLAQPSADRSLQPASGIDGTGANQDEAQPQSVPGAAGENIRQIAAKTGLSLDTILAQPIDFYSSLRSGSGKPLNTAEHLQLFNYIWDSRRQTNRLSEALVTKLIENGHFDLLGFLVSGKFGPEHMRILTRENTLSPGDSKILWGIFHEDEPLLSDSSYPRPDLLGGAISKSVTRLDGIPRVLDLGCGKKATALIGFTKEMDASGKSIEAHGVDIAPESTGVVDGVNIRQADIRGQLPYEDQYFDVIYESGVMEYYTGTSYLEKIFAEIKRVLKPGGRFICDSLPGAKADIFTNYFKGEGYKNIPNREELLIVEKPSGILINENLAVVPAEKIEPRQATTVEALASSEGKDNDVKVVVGVPVDMNRADVQPTLSAINRGLAKHGFGRMEDNKQVIIFEIDVNDQIKTAQNQERAMKNATERLSPNGRVVLFAPQMEGGPKLAGKTKEECKGQDNIIVIPDAYTDSAPDKNIFPDIMVRVALGRNIAFYYTGNDPPGTLAIINDLLSKVTDGQPPIVTIDDLFNLLRPLRIRPVDFNTLSDWQRAQQAIATSL
ncbi:MAG: class I SAM-dependent methyltransferase [Candidatus Omnitrophota bacterium]|nr:class I SAM-dependent methyltransferase [Candidatus Omnitrophota bacterium]